MRPAINAWRKKKGLPIDPIAENRRSGYETRTAGDRRRRREELNLSRGGSYA